MGLVYLPNCSMPDYYGKCREIYITIHKYTIHTWIVTFKGHSPTSRVWKKTTVFATGRNNKQDYSYFSHWQWWWGGCYKAGKFPSFDGQAGWHFVMCFSLLGFEKDAWNQTKVANHVVRPLLQLVVFHQPLWKICLSVKMGIFFPKVRREHKKYLKFHHLDYHCVSLTTIFEGHLSANGCFFFLSESMEERQKV